MEWHYRVTLKVPWWPPYEHIWVCFLIKKKSPFSCLNVEFCLSRCYGAWTVTCTFQYRLWTGSIKPSLQHFQFCSVGLSLGILFFSTLKKRKLLIHKIYNVTRIVYFLFGFKVQVHCKWFYLFQSFTLFLAITNMYKSLTSLIFNTISRVIMKSEEHNGCYYMIIVIVDTAHDVSYASLSAYRA
jgi:hypothetical protein